MSGRVEIETIAGAFTFEIDEDGALSIMRDGAQVLAVVKEDALYPAWLALLNEVLAIGADLDETEKAFRREEERAGNAVRNWNEDAAMRERENQELIRRVRLASERADATLMQLGRERAKRAEISGVLPCPQCASEYTTPIFARSEGKPGVIAVCCDCQAFAPWREIEPT